MVAHYSVLFIMAFLTIGNQGVEPKDADFVYHPKINKFGKLHIGTSTMEETISIYGTSFQETETVDYYSKSATDTLWGKSLKYEKFGLRFLFFKSSKNDDDFRLFSVVVDANYEKSIYDVKSGQTRFKRLFPLFQPISPQFSYDTNNSNTFKLVFQKENARFYSKPLSKGNYDMEKENWKKKAKDMIVQEIELGGREISGFD